ncbi:MAG: hypothetical protein FJ278_18910, partial [Planctomycetes bacterium]|nr:hypothetical protein [Planctomycetota bacterium]
MSRSNHCAHLPAHWRCPLWLAALALWAATALAADKVGCYVSTGDNDWLWTSPPVNSEASIEALFDSMQKVFGVDRVYWRGSHSEWVVDRFVSRPESFHLHDFWVWQRHLIKDVGQTALALRAARKRGMEIWGFSPLFDHGAHARSDAAKLGLPAVIENRLRVEHPEWVPVDRHGRRRQAGPIELAYPEARKALVEQYVEMANRGYDGVAFYTYVEHTSFRFEDEFGYGPPIVDEFKRRYGQDIRSEPFDKHAWYRLRGEYVTQFLRELSAAYRRHGKKLGMAIDPQETHYPAPWLGLGRDLRPAGRIYMDWERWVREGLVDEIMVYCNGPLEAALNAVLAETRGTSCAVSAIRGSAPFTPEHQHFTAAGVRRVMVGSAAELEWGYPAEQPASALEGEDFLARLRVLRQAEEKKTTIPATQLVAATRDANVLVRRQAIRALESLAPSEALPAIEAALGDSEVGVRCVAAAALAKLNRPTTVPRLFEALRRGPGFQFEQAAGNTLANLPLAFTADILKGCRDADVTVRRVTAYALSR